MTRPPVRDYTPEKQSVLSRLSTAMETATDALAVALDEEAKAENAYLLEYHKAWLTTDDVPASIRQKATDQVEAVMKARQKWNLAKATAKGSSAKVDELKNRMMAAMSHQKFVAAQT